MAKDLAPVLLNPLQLETLGKLRNEADDNGVIQGTVVAGFKQNIIGALERRGIIKLFRGKHYKLTGAPVAPKPPTIHRQPKVEATAE